MNVQIEAGTPDLIWLASQQKPVTQVLIQILKWRCNNTQNNCPVRDLGACLTPYFFFRWNCIERKKIVSSKTFLEIDVCHEHKNVYIPLLLLMDMLSHFEDAKFYNEDPENYI